MLFLGCWLASPECYWKDNSRIYFCAIEYLFIKCFPIFFDKTWWNACSAWPELSRGRLICWCPLKIHNKSEKCRMKSIWLVWDVATVWTWDGSLVASIKIEIQAKFSVASKTRMSCSCPWKCIITQNTTERKTGSMVLYSTAWKMWPMKMT